MKDNKEIIDTKIMEYYKLSEEEHEKIYKQIEFDMFNGLKQENTPVAFIVGGQPGSGKSGLIMHCEKAFKDNNYAIITVDKYKEYHPKSLEILQKHPTLYTTIVGQDSNKWTSRILAKAIECKYNFIFEITLKNDTIIGTLEKLKFQEYKVNIEIISTSNLESLMSIHERYQRQMEQSKIMRLARIVRHNIAYNNMPNVIEIIEKSKQYDELKVYIRGNKIDEPELIYENNSISNKYNTAKEAVLESRKTSQIQLGEFKNRYDFLEKEFLKRKLTNDEKEQLKELKEIIYKQ